MLFNCKLTTLLLSFLLFTITSWGQNFSPEEQKQLDSLNAIINNKTSHDTSLASAYVALSDILYVSNLDTMIPLCTKAKEIAEKTLSNRLGQKQEHNIAITLSLRKTLAGALNNIGSIYDNKGETSLALEYYQKSLKIYKEIGDKKGVANCFNNIAFVYDNQGDISNALDYQYNSLKIREQIGDKIGQANSFNNIGFIYDNQGDVSRALEYYHKSLKIREQIGDKKGMANCFNNIGSVYENQGEAPLALEYFNKSLKIREQIGDKRGMAIALNNIGLIFSRQADIPMALNYYHKSLKIREQIGDKKGMAITLNNIGSLYENQGNITLALEYYHKSLKIREQIGDKKGVTNSLSNLGSLYLKQGNANQAKQMGIRGLQLARELGFPEDIQSNATLLTKVYTKEGNYKLALEMRNLEVQMRDSVLSEKNMKASVQQQAKFEYKKQQAINDAEHQKEKEKQQLLTYIAAAGLLLVLAFLAFVFNRLQVTRKQKKIIEEKEQETKHQKEIIQEKHKEIADSINYAERIQKSFLATKESLDQKLKEYFIFYKPKHVVSGDFYWLMDKNNKLYICTADCTGHGIPGAFMSLIGMGVLNEIFYSKTNFTHTDEILNELRRIIILAVNPENATEEAKDGMDAVLYSLDFDKMELEYSSANNSFFIIRNGELLVFKPDKMPVGKYIGEEKPFTRNSFSIQKGDCIYTFSDGMPDQFGGDKGKKYMIKNLKQLFLNIANLPMKEQQTRVAEEFNRWKGELEQVDDVCVIGVRI
jgi:tetratricopeptide (TPR) repeat protein